MIDEYRRFRKTIAPYFYESGYNPFSMAYNQAKVDDYITKLDSNGQPTEIHNLKQYRFFHEFHKRLFRELEAEVNKLSTTKEDFIRTEIAIANEIYFKLKKQIQENLPEDNATALNFRNVTVEKETTPDNPQPLNGLLENTIEYLNLLINYAKRKQFVNNDIAESEEEIIKRYETIFKNANEYSELKHHFDSCLNCSGKITCENERIVFEVRDVALSLSLQLMEVIIENNSQFSYFSFENALQKGGIIRIPKREHNFILDKVSFENGEWKYNLKERSDTELATLLVYEIIIKDYYPFITEIELLKLERLTLRDLLLLSESMSELAYSLHTVLQTRETNNEIESIKDNNAPLIHVTFLKTYLIAVTGLTEKQIMKYLEMQTNSWSQNLYAKPLIKIGDSYIFPFLPVAAYNHFFLLDHWLEVADISLDERGIKFQEIVKNKMKIFKDKIFNKYKVIDQNEISVTINSKRQMEEIDLIVELKDVLLIGEIKCIKYPMSERECFDGITQRVDEAIQQLLTKEQFLVQNAEEIKRKYNFDAKKKIVKVVVLNYPVYNCYTVEGIPVVDYKTLLSYFHSSGYSIKSMNVQEMEVVTRESYYTSEETFNSNLLPYLCNSPEYNYFKSGMNNRMLSYRLPILDLEVLFNDYRINL